MELEDGLYEKILNMCSKGDDFVNDCKYDDAIDMYLKALELIPQPKCDWEASTWIYTALGDTCYIKRDFIDAKNYLFDAVNCPNGAENPFIMLRLGESLFELGEIKKSKEYLLRAYMIEGYSIFYSEDDKYFNIIANTL